MRSQSNKTMACATGTLVVQFDNRSDAAAAFERAVDARGVLRRTGQVTAREQGELTEVRCAVEYGPVFGCNESDVRRQLQAIVGALGPGVRDSAVFSFSRRELRAEDVARTIEGLEAQADDITLSLDARKELSSTIARLKQQVA